MMTHDKDEKIIVFWAGDGLVTQETGAINSHTAYLILSGTLHKFWNWYLWRGWLYPCWAWLCVILDILTDTRLVRLCCIVVSTYVAAVTTEYDDENDDNYCGIRYMVQIIWKVGPYNCLWLISRRNFTLRHLFWPETYHESFDGAVTNFWVPIFNTFMYIQCLQMFLIIYFKI